MQLYALDKRGTVISARLAEKKQNYRCLECGGMVRLRGGLQRQNHFYHHQVSDSCSQNGKSMAHLQLQCHLQKVLFDAELERPFPEIRRIADVVWEKEKLIFEVQCSPISREEVENRNRDYASLGYQVIWILHDHRFNQVNLSLAELFLADAPHYYTNMNAEGKGTIYDQFRLGSQKLSPLEVDLSQPGFIQETSSCSSFLQRRLGKWPLFFEGDLATLISRGEKKEYLEQMIQLEAAGKRGWVSLIWRKGVVEPYRKLFLLLLESCCG